MERPGGRGLVVEGAAGLAAGVGQALLSGALPAPGNISEFAVRCMTGLCEAIVRRGQDGEARVPSAGLAAAEALI